MVERGFTDEELIRFFEAISDVKDRVSYQFMAILGLRVGELCSLKGKDFDRDTLELRIPSAKGSYQATLKLPEALVGLVPEVRDEEPLFGRTRKQLADHFHVYRERAGLNEIYMHSEPCGRAGTRNPRYRLTMHSLRHYGIQRIHRMTKDPDLTRRFARHRHQETTAIYLQKSRKDEVEAMLERMTVTETLTATEMGTGGVPLKKNQ